MEIDDEARVAVLRLLAAQHRAGAQALTQQLGTTTGNAGFIALMQNFGSASDVHVFDNEMVVEVNTEQTQSQISKLERAAAAIEEVADVVSKPNSPGSRLMAAVNKVGEISTSLGALVSGVVAIGSGLTG